MQGKKPKKTKKTRKKHVFFPKKTRNEKNGFFHNPSQTTYSPTAFDGKKNEKKVDTGVQFDKLNFFSDDTDWSGLEHKLKQQDWVSEFRSLDPQQMLDKFLEICTAVSLKYVPIRKIDGSSKSKSQIPRERKNLMRKRRRINLQLRKTASEA